MGKQATDFSDQDITEVASYMAEFDLVGISSMTQYSSIVHKIIARIRDFSPKTFIIWGGIHPIIHPEDAIQHADAICTGEGEFAVSKFLELFKIGDDFTSTPGFWFNTSSGVVKNLNLPLMKPEEMDELPPLTYQDGELLYHPGRGFLPITYRDFVNYTGLSYNTVWSIGCPLKCTYCGNSKFIDYDKNYRKIRHSSPQIIVDEIKRAVSKHPHITTILFHDDSFLALPMRTLEEFSSLYKKQISLPFGMFGVIPNYVREDKIALLLDAGMIRLRMGIQSGSQKILDFYDRPTPINRIRDAIETLNKFKKFMIPPSFDIIIENPLESSEDMQATLDLIYSMPRPYFLNIYALRVIPNTQLAFDLKKRNVEVPPIDKNYFTGYNPTLGNILIFLLVLWRLPSWLYNRLRNKVLPITIDQRKYPVSFSIIRSLY